MYRVQVTFDDGRKLDRIWYQSLTLFLAKYDKGDIREFLAVEDSIEPHDTPPEERKAA